jgi:hypothetical protein
MLAALVLLALVNPIVEENAKPGTDRWQLASRASTDIEGYASATSVAAGDELRVYVSTADPTYSIEFFRMGWYAGLGGRRMTNAVDVAAKKQDVPAPDPVTGLIACRWTDPYTITIPADWLSGVYLVKLTARPSSRQNYVIFVVRDDRRADLLFQTSVTTWQAYNNWGGKSLYAHNSTGAAATKVSFDRPYSLAAGPGDFLYRWEYPMLRWLEREGFDVTYATNTDTHAQPAPFLRRVRAFLSVGHDEYWSWEMRTNVEAARDRGVNLAFFSANTCYWQIRFEHDLRTIVAYKETALASDPIAQDGNPTNDHLTTTLWRDVPVSRAEESMIGVMYTESPVDADIVVENASHWVFAGTGLKPGDRLPGLLGYEVDRIFGIASPANLVRLAHSPFVSAEGESGTSDMTIYETSNGAIVFATGSIQWSWGLDDFNANARGSRLSVAAQRVTRNVLERMTASKRRRAVAN